ncbi:ABC transporter G family member 11 [Gracilariopsis chorda]|uniref:Probable ATP-dependent transporter ycf16 n=1 Tax=Gracilariopsis chorda TaxID=448386 RepID=A0A2V3IPC2_9FLOR|nr:ABC transporter G family member 11 [Gracilariopsis chorda]|eukprot:PXF43928.1 ABC transporter G family member 11 [Gracilariopsis chorda]
MTENSPDLHRSTSALATSGSTLSWNAVSVDVPLSKKAATRDPESPSVKRILNNVSGYVKPGQLLFCMGPSGSGKSSLLDALADRIKLPVQGTQVLDGKVKTAHGLKAIAKYVQQTDDLLGVLTVRETLQTAAEFYLSDASARPNAVDEVIDILGLRPHEHTKIGNALVRGLSGGQIRRVSIGCELVAAPKLIFLDEPTSGLDSATAFHVMTELKRIAKTTGMSMIITLHQPSELVFEMADTLLLISSGSTCYFGPAHEASKYFHSLGFSKPSKSSDIEWMLELVNQDFGRLETVEKCIRSWPRSEHAANLQHEVEDMEASCADLHGGAGKRMERMNYASSFLQQTITLTRRGVLNTIRNPAVLWLRFAMYLMLSLMIGLVWLRLGNSASVLNDYNTALFYTCAFMIFMSVSVLPAYLEERSVLVRERANGAYSVGAYILAHTLYEIPYVFLLALMASSVTYWMVGLTAGAKRFFIFVANLFLSLFVAESMMVLISAVIPILIVGIAAGAMTFGLFMCVMGAFISIDRIGWWIRWIRYVAAHFYSYSTFLVNQFRDTTWEASPDTFPPFLEPVAGESVYRAQGLEERLWVNFVALIAMIVFYRIVAAIWLQLFLKGKR